MKPSKLTLCFGIFLLSLCIGCAPSNISKVQEKYGPPADSVQKGNVTVNFFYTYYGEGFKTYGWWCEEYTCEKDGSIIKKRSYWIGNHQSLKDFKELLKQGVLSQ